MTIHPTAVVEAGAELADGVEVGPFCHIQSGVTLGAGVRIQSHVVLYPGTTIGEGSEIWSHAAIGGAPQALGFDPSTPTFVRIGARTTVREGVTIHRALREGATTEVGDDCYLMAYCHVGHDCRLGSHVIVTTLAGLAGHCLLEDRAIIGGVTGLHQFVRIGTMAMVGGVSRINRDAPPYIISASVPQEEIGLNTVGLQRNGVSPESIKSLKAAFRLIYRSKLNRTQALERVRAEVPPCPEVDHLIDFLGAVDDGAKGRALDR